MATIKGIKANYSSTITATYGGKSATALLYVTLKAGNVAYSISSGVSLYCTTKAEAKTSTDSTVAKAYTFTSSTTSSYSADGQNTYSYAITGVKKGGSTVTGHGLTLTDGSTIKVPSGLAAGVYTVTITATAAAVTNKYTSATASANLTLTITETKISEYGNVSQPSITQKANFPAGGVTLTKTNAGTYFTGGTSTQTITYNNGATRGGNITYAWSGSDTTITSLGTTAKAVSSVTINKLTYTATGEGSKTNSNSVSSGKQAANSEGTTKYSTSNGSATGSNWTYGTPTKVTKKTGADLIHGGSDTVSSSVNNNEQYWLKWTSGSYKEHNDKVAGSVGFAFVSGSVTSNSGSADFTMGTVSNSGNTYSVTITHRDMGAITVNSVTDTCEVYAYNTTVEAANSKKTSGDNNAKWSITNTRTKVIDNITEWGTPSISFNNVAGFTAAGGSSAITCSVTNKQGYHYEYTDSVHNESANAHTESVAGTARWRITNQYIGTAANSTTGTAITRFSHPSTGSENLTIGSTATATYATGTSVSHSSMTNNVGYDIVEVTAYNAGSTRTALSTAGTSTAKKASATLATNSKGVKNVLTWSNPTITKANASTAITNDAATVTMTVSGSTFTFAPTITQSGAYTSGTTASNTTATYTYAITTAQTGYSLSSNVLTAANNNSTSARNGCKVTITATGSGSKTDTAVVTFNQAAGAKVYNNPTILTYAYSTFGAGGGTKTPTTPTYSQVWTWNGVANSGGTLTSGGALAYSTTGTLPSGFSTATDFSTTGNVTWANRTSTVGNARDAKSNLQVTVTMNGKTSSAFTCTSCVQEANSLGTTKYKDKSGTTGYNITYVAPVVSIATGITAAGGSGKVTCTVTNTTDWYQKYTSGTYTSKQTGTEAGTARWRITSNGNDRFSHPSTGSENLTIGGSSIATYATGTSVSHTSMTSNVTTDSVTVTAYNTADTSKSATATSSAKNEVTGIKLSLNSNAVSANGGHITGHPADAHYDLAYNDTCTPTVLASFTSGSKDIDVTNRLSASNYTSSDTSVVTIS